ADRGLDPSVGVDDVERVGVHVAAVGDPEAAERGGAQHRMVGPDQQGVTADLLRTEPGARPEAHAAVERNAQDRHVETAGVLLVGQPHERRELGVPGGPEGIGGLEALRRGRAHDPAAAPGASSPPAESIRGAREARGPESAPAGASSTPAVRADPMSAAVSSRSIARTRRFAPTNSSEVVASRVRGRGSDSDTSARNRPGRAVMTYTRSPRKSASSMSCVTN